MRYATEQIVDHLSQKFPNADRDALTGLVRAGISDNSADLAAWEQTWQWCEAALAEAALAEVVS